MSPTHFITTATFIQTLVIGFPFEGGQYGFGNASSKMELSRFIRTKQVEPLSKEKAKAVSNLFWLKNRKCFPLTHGRGIDLKDIVHQVTAPV